MVNNFIKKALFVMGGGYYKGNSSILSTEEIPNNHRLDV